MKWDEKERHRKKQRKIAHKTMKQATSILAVRIKQQLLSYQDHWPIVLFSFDLETFKFSILAIITHSHTVWDYLMPHLNCWCFFVCLCVSYALNENIQCIKWFLIFKTVCNSSIDYNFFYERKYTIAVWSNCWRAFRRAIFLDIKLNYMTNSKYKKPILSCIEIPPKNTQTLISQNMHSLVWFWR